MNTAWKKHLDNTPMCSSSELPDCSLCDLSHLGLIAVEGEDAVSFMQGQFTNDSREVNVGHSQLSALCSPKGRMLGLFRIIGIDQGWLLQLPQELLASIHKRLQMFVLRSKVSLKDASADWVQLGLAGDCAEALLQQVLGHLPTEIDAATVTNGIHCVRLGGDRPRFLLLVPAAQAESVWQQLSAVATACDSSAWRLLAIRAGEPMVHEATVEAFVPQMTNMQRVNGLSFSKGCYTGQEVVARMQYLGKLKRRMYRAQVASAEPVNPGIELFSPQSKSGQGAGRVVEAARVDDQNWELLAVMEISLSEGAIHLGSPEGPLLKILSLPYAFQENPQQSC